MKSRPKSVADILRITVDFLDLFDRSMTIMSNMLEKDAPSNDRYVQGDLMMIAEWMRTHPEIDARIMEVLSADEYMKD